MLAQFYTTKTAETHGTGYCAYYKGRNDQYYGDKRLARSAFKSDADYADYKRGWKSSTAETRLDNDTEWDD